MSTPLRILVQGQDVLADGSRSLIIGRDPKADIVVDSDRISRRHAELVPTTSGWRFRDLGSSNGSFEAGRRISEVPVDTGAEILLGGAQDGIYLRFRALKAQTEPGNVPIDVDTPSRLGMMSVIHPLPVGRIRIGRAPDNDLVLEDLLVSRYHAVIERDSTGSYQVKDLGSHNGVFINGQRQARAPLHEGDVVTLGAQIYRFSQGRLEQYLDQGSAWLCASGLSVVTADRRRILDDVSFALEPSSLLAIVGPSGSGKTTLVNALTGFNPASEGIVLYGGRDLYAAYDDLRHRMGYVPQEDLIHRELTIRQALDYAAELRFPPDVDRRSRLARVDEVTAELGLSERVLLAIHKLSGGQRKRTSVAVELLTKPSLLFLDEPTSGLDPGNDEQLMLLLRDLAHGGRIVVVVTHSLDGLDLCDRVLFLAPGGMVAYYGPPAEAREFFARDGSGERYAAIFRTLAEADGAERLRRFKKDPAFELYVRQPLASAELAASPRAIAEATASGNALSPLRQLWILVRRYGSILAADRRMLALLALQAPFFALLFILLYGSNRMSPQHAQDAIVLLWLLAVGATYIGTSNSIREIVKERAILRRERAVGLSLGAYLGSKVLVLGTIALVQGAFLVALATLPHDLSGPGAVLSSQRPELMIVGAVAAFGAVAVGLLFSALARTADLAGLLLPVVLVGQMVLSAPLGGGAVISAAGTLSTARWATSANASTVDMNVLRHDYEQGLLFLRVATEYADAHGYTSVSQIPPIELPAVYELIAEDAPDQPSHLDWQRTAPVWGAAIAAILLLSAAAVAAAFFVLRRQDALPTVAPQAKAMGARAAAARGGQAG